MWSAPDSRRRRRWDGCERLRVGKVDVETADLVHHAWQTRTSLVLELAPGLGLDRPDEPPADSVTGLQPWEWEVDLDLVGERLHHAVWANSVDARGAAPRYHWADQAVALGAQIDRSGQADVVFPDGQPAICDGGPLDASLASRMGVATLHRIGLEHRSLTPLGNPGPRGVPLAPDQLAAVGEPRAAARVIAPAGSGKTRVLTERARLLQAGWGLPARRHGAGGLQRPGRQRDAVPAAGAALPPDPDAQRPLPQALRAADHHRGAGGPRVCWADWSSFPAGPRPTRRPRGSKR